MFEGDELAWLENDLDAYILQVNGSGKLRLTDGSIIYVGYAGKTDREYVGLGKSMVEAGLIDKNKLSLPAIREYYLKDPERVRELMKKNESYVFFGEYDGNAWPSGSLGVKVTEGRTLATDKKIYPRGGIVMVDTKAADFTMGKKNFKRIMLDQDTGGAIKAPGRADIYMGIGPAAEQLAGRQYNEGTLYYFFLKPEYVEEYLGRAGAAAARSGAGAGCWRAGGAADGNARVGGTQFVARRGDRRACTLPVASGPSHARIAGDAPRAGPSVPEEARARRRAGCAGRLPSASGRFAVASDRTSGTLSTARESPGACAPRARPAPSEPTCSSCS
jgi:3D (Asp-Asp-Asp) domain-containing protein